MVMVTVMSAPATSQIQDRTTVRAQAQRRARMEPMRSMINRTERNA